MKRIIELHATPVESEAIIFGKVPLVNSNWEGPIDVYIKYSDGSDLDICLRPEEYRGLEEDMRTGREVSSGLIG